MTIGKYNVIYADPPWRYAQKGLQGAAERHYPTMGIEELCVLPVAELAAPDSVLFMWATFPQLPEALRLIKAWGFQYKSVGLYYTILCALRDNGNIRLAKTFWTGFRDNFRQATMSWLVLLVFSVLIYLEIFWCGQFSGPITVSDMGCTH